MGPSGPEFHNASSLGCTNYPVGFSGYQGLMIYKQKNHGLNELSLYDRASDCYNGLSRKNRGAFRNCPYITNKFEVFQILQKFLVKNAFASQKLNILIGKFQIAEI